MGERCRVPACPGSPQQTLKMNRQALFLISALSLGIAAAVIVNSEPFIRRIPADVLRDFPGKCFAWTAVKWYSPNETWSLKPFCGRSRCTILRNIRTNETFLSEEVTDCGPLIDLKKHPNALIWRTLATPRTYFLVVALCMTVKKGPRSSIRIRPVQRNLREKSSSK